MVDGVGRSLAGGTELRLLLGGAEDGADGSQRLTVRGALLSRLSGRSPFLDDTAILGCGRVVRVAVIGWRSGDLRSRVWQIKKELSPRI